MATALITRAEARAQGLKRYFSGEPCIYGHVSERYVKGNACRTCRTIRKHVYRAANREKVRAQGRALRAANPEKRRAATQRWQQTPEGRAVKARLQRERRARLRGSDGSHTQQDIEEILASQGHRCAYCRSDIRGRHEVDHIVPLKLGGSNGRRNIQMVCAHCNRKKRTKEPERYAREMGLLI